MTRYRLVSFKTCPWVQRAAIVLREKAVDFELVHIEPGNRPDWFKPISPHGKVLVLQIDDNVALFKSNAISEYLDETIEPRLHPADPITRASNRAWTDYIPSFSAATGSVGSAATEEELAKAREALFAVFARLEEALERHGEGPFFNGADYALVDSGYAPFLQRYLIVEDISGDTLSSAFPRLRRFSDGQVEAWSAVTANVLPVAPSAVAASGSLPIVSGTKPFPVPRAAELNEIPDLVDQFREAASNSKRAGFDGIALHAANGFLIEQFLRDDANTRTDAYGGAIENRARFLLEVVDAAIEVFGPAGVGVRISPHFDVDGRGDSDPAALYAYVARELHDRDIAYLHLIEPDATAAERRLSARIRKIFAGPLILAGEFTRDTALAAIEGGRADFVAFGRLYIANPDLVDRFRLDHVPLNPPDVATFQNGEEAGYIDYPFLEPVPVPAN